MQLFALHLRFISEVKNGRIIDVENKVDYYCIIVCVDTYIINTNHCIC